MNIKDFLIDNYIWIIFIILITIITIIGFLADKKKSEKKTEKVSKDKPNEEIPTNNIEQIGAPQPVENNQMNNNMGMNFNNVNVPIQPQNQNINMPSNQNVGNLNNMNQTTTPQPVENIAQNTTIEPIHQPLSEQKTVIKPQPIPNFSNMSNNNGAMNQMPQSNNISPNQNTQNIIQPFGQTPRMQETNQNQNYNIPTQRTQSVGNNNQGMMPNFIPNNTTVPQPVNPVPTPQPVNPQSIMNHNNNQMVRPNLGQNLGQNQPMNFVYGPQQNNNQNM